jgi:hypothetical protein
MSSLSVPCPAAVARPGKINLVDASKSKLLRPSVFSDSSESLEALDPELQELSVSQEVPVLNVAVLKALTDAEGFSLGGSFNTPFLFWDGEKAWVIKIPHALEMVTSAMHELSAPERAVRVMREIHPELEPKVVNIQGEDGKFYSAWMLRYVEGRQSRPDEIEKAIQEIFLKTKRIIPDCFCPRNFLTESGTGKVYCVDVDMAINLSMMSSEDGLSRPVSPTSKSAWVRGEPIHDGYYERFSGKLPDVPKEYQRTMSRCGELLECAERYAKISAEMPVILEFQELIKALVARVRKEFHFYRQCADVYVSMSLKHKVLGYCSDAEFMKLEKIRQFARCEAKSLEDFAALIFQIQELATKNLSDTVSFGFKRSLEELKNRLIAMGGEEALRAAEADFLARNKPRMSIVVGAVAGVAGSVFERLSGAASTVSTGVASRASGIASMFGIRSFTATAAASRGVALRGMTSSSEGDGTSGILVPSSPTVTPEHD